jgi:hypothetical protein
MHLTPDDLDALMTEMHTSAMLVRNDQKEFGDYAAHMLDRAIILIALLRNKVEELQTTTECELNDDL